MTSVSLPILAVYALCISGLLAWLNRRGAGALEAGIWLLAVSVAVALPWLGAFGVATRARHLASLWLMFVLIPGAVVFAASRLSALQASPGWLLFVGPLSFVVSLVVATMVFNMLLASVR